MGVRGGNRHCGGRRPLRPSWSRTVQGLCRPFKCKGASKALRNYGNPVLSFVPSAGNFGLFSSFLSFFFCGQVIRLITLACSSGAFLSSMEHPSFGHPQVYHHQWAILSMGSLFRAMVLSGVPAEFGHPQVHHQEPSLLPVSGSIGSKSLPGRVWYTTGVWAPPGMPPPPPFLRVNGSFCQTVSDTLSLLGC